MCYIDEQKNKYSVDKSSLFCLLEKKTSDERSFNYFVTNQNLSKWTVHSCRLINTQAVSSENWKYKIKSNQRHIIQLYLISINCKDPLHTVTSVHRVSFVADLGNKEHKFLYYWNYLQN
jgi:hypothetical protein